MLGAFFVIFPGFSGLLSVHFEITLEELCKHCSMQRKVTPGPVSMWARVAEFMQTSHKIQIS